MSEPVLSHKIEYRIPFLTAKQAQIAANSLSPDPVLRPSELNVTCSTEENVLKILFEGISDRIIRVVANNTIDNLKTIIECIEVFDPTAQ